MKILSEHLYLAVTAAGFSLLGLASPARAQNCVASDCYALGYTKSESSCEGDIIRCPFDTSKVFCKEKEVYVLQAGDILFSDRTTNHYYVDDNKTPIGVVVDPSRRLAMALKCELKQWANSGYNKTNFPEIPDMESADAKNDFNGKYYTQIIVNRCGYNCPAAYYAYNYSTPGTSRGEWFLPSGGELWQLEVNKAQVKMGLAKAGGKLPYGNSIYTYIESSTEGPDKYSDFKMAVYLDFEEDRASRLDYGNKYKAAYTDKDFACPFIRF